jgi:hypothetical protein
MKPVHICCIVIAIVVLFFLLNRVSMYTDDKPMTCTCTSASSSEPANTVAPVMTPGAMMPEPTMSGAMMPGAMIGN